MGGKGGDDDGGAAAVRAQYDSTSHPGYYINRTTGEVLASDGYTSLGNKDTVWPTAAPAAAAPAAAPEAAPAPAAPAPEPEVAPPDPPAQMGPSIGAGGSISQPTVGGNATSANSGDVLGGSVMKPPNYWVGGISTPTSGRGSGRLTTTQT